MGPLPSTRPLALGQIHIHEAAGAQAAVVLLLALMPVLILVLNTGLAPSLAHGQIAMLKLVLKLVLMLVLSQQT